MTDSEIRQIVVDIIEIIAPDADVSNIKDDVRLRDQLELDSMDFLDIVMELRKRFNIEVPEKDYQELISLGSCVAYLFPRLKDRELVS
ncbi:MAG: acyl carrier protein [Planctomycetes bacterium]|nr:acyl carrier protein [Planctomycetota bacterium]